MRVSPSVSTHPPHLPPPPSQALEVIRDSQEDSPPPPLPLSVQSGPAAAQQVQPVQSEQHVQQAPAELTVCGYNSVFLSSNGLKGK